MYKWNWFLVWLPLMGGCWTLSEEEIAAHQDADADGFSREVDCNDKLREVNPGAAEVCDGIDNDCDGFWDDVEDCDDDGFTEDDCDPWDAARYPGAPELNDGFDNDCDGEFAANECGQDSGLKCARDSTALPDFIGDPGCRCAHGSPFGGSLVIMLVASLCLCRRRG